mgnify:CR=1 FL=1
MKSNRMDLTIMTPEYGIRNIRHDKLCVILMDKDGVLPEIPAPSDESHWVKKPTAAEYFCCSIPLSPSILSGICIYSRLPNTSIQLSSAMKEAVSRTFCI